MEDDSPVELLPCCEYSILYRDMLCRRGTLRQNSQAGRRNSQLRPVVIFSLATGLTIAG
jgi:hypothetical protein